MSAFSLPSLSSFFPLLCWYDVTAAKEVAFHEKFQAVSRGVEQGDLGLDQKRRKSLRLKMIPWGLFFTLTTSTSIFSFLLVTSLLVMTSQPPLLPSTASSFLGFLPLFVYALNPNTRPLKELEFTAFTLLSVWQGAQNAENLLRNFTLNGSPSRWWKTKQLKLLGGVTIFSVYVSQGSDIIASHSFPCILTSQRGT